MLTLYPVACTTERGKGNSLSAASLYLYFFSISVVLGTQRCVSAPVQPHACRQAPEARLAWSPAASVPHLKNWKGKAKLNVIHDVKLLSLLQFFRQIPVKLCCLP